MAILPLSSSAAVLVLAGVCVLVAPAASFSPQISALASHRAHGACSSHTGVSMALSGPQASRRNFLTLSTAGALAVVSGGKWACGGSGASADGDGGRAGGAVDRGGQQALEEGVPENQGGGGGREEESEGASPVADGPHEVSGEGGGDEEASQEQGRDV
eukprot:CAMPEP_0181318344 /NCGR_PEP_ID=MMETSP1101-20121128/16954_1 /TAXON_ID=46948 /ORGANISM="Rhodomonas abbreviata, Strain Caron Lab Isolate" /LENGTH=158 /DNA_ID=CAMNT_0023425803 /DNA_START=9 /DNA_END=484 /DNA_ORIENTATION=-